MDNDVREFNLNSEYFVGRAIDCESDGDIPNAIYNVKRAIALEDDDLYLRLKLASYYELMGLYEDANDIYVDIVVKNGAIMHCFYSLCDNMFYIGDTNAAHYYYRQYCNIADTEEDKNEIAGIVLKHMQEADREKFFEVPKRVTEKRSPDLDTSMRLASGGRDEEAEPRLEAVSIASIDGQLAKERLAAVKYRLHKYREAMDVCGEILDFDSESVAALRTGYFCAKRLRKNEVAEEYIAKLIAIDSPDRDVRMRVIFALTETGRDDEALERCESYCFEFPYDLDARRQLGALYYNVGRYREAADTFAAVIKVSDIFGEVKYYRNLAVIARDRGDTSCPKKRIEDTAVLPISEIDRRINYVADAADRGDTSCWKDERFVEWLTFVLGDDYSVDDFDDESMSMTEYIVAELLFEPCREACSYFLDALLKSYVPGVVKRYIIHAIAYSGSFSEVRFVYENILCDIKLDKRAKEYPEIFREAYAYVVSILGVITRGFERELKKAVSAAIEAYAKVGKKYVKYEALAAAIVSSMDIRLDLSDLDVLSDIFCCNKTLLKRYKKELGI